MGGLEPLNYVSGSSVEDSQPSFDEGMATSAEDMGPPISRIAGGDQVDAGLNTVPSGERLDLGTRNACQGLEVEGCERLSPGQPVLAQMALDAARIAIGEFDFGRGSKKAEAGQPSVSARAASAAGCWAGAAQ